eukprot:1886206-Prymnesium_polylepis.2
MRRGLRESRAIRRSGASSARGLVWWRVRTKEDPDTWQHPLELTLDRCRLILHHTGSTTMVVGYLVVPHTVMGYPWAVLGSAPRQ